MRRSEHRHPRTPPPETELHVELVEGRRLEQLPGQRVALESVLLLLRVPAGDAVELEEVVRAEQEDDHVGLEGEGALLEEATLVGDRPVPAAPVQDLDPAAARGELALEPRRIGVVVLDVEAERRRVAATEDRSEE